MGQAPPYVSAADAQLGLNHATELWADDVTRGYRVDVEDVDAENNPVWRSLCARRPTYRIRRLAGPDAVLRPGRDEGTVTPAVTQDVDKTKNDLFFHETVFHWDGWSLAAPRPGEAIQPDGHSHDELKGNPSATTLELEVTTTSADGSLTRLRFGRTYRLRRVVIEEYESFLHDSLKIPTEDDPRFGSGTDRRLVYADAVEVDPGGGGP